VTRRRRQRRLINIGYESDNYSEKKTEQLLAMAQANKENDECPGVDTEWEVCTDNSRCA